MLTDGISPQGNILVRNTPSPEGRVEIAAKIIDGFTQPEIAELLFISLSTVQSHANSIYRKTGVNNKMQLAKRPE